MNGNSYVLRREVYSPRSKVYSGSYGLKSPLFSRPIRGIRACKGDEKIGYKSLQRKSAILQGARG